MVNVSTHLFPSEKWIILPTSEIIIKISTLIPVVIFGLFGNFALAYVIMKYKHLRTPTNMVIANMATVDFASLLLYPWIFLAVDCFQNYQLGEFGCMFEGWLECSFLLTNVLNLSTISYDRLTAIVLPRETRLSHKSAKIIIVTSWIIGFGLASPLVIYRQYRKRQWLDFLEIYCTESKVLAVYWLILLTMLVWLPLAIMLICYIAIFIKLDRYEQKVLRREHPLSVCYKMRVAKVLFVVVITFIICRTPFTALIFKRNNWLKQHQQNQILASDTILWYIARYILYVNAALDPLIYGLTNEKFRKAFRSTPLIRIFFFRKVITPNNVKPRINVIQPRGPYRTEPKSDKWLILNVKNISEYSKGNIPESSQAGSQNVLVK